MIKNSSYSKANKSSLNVFPLWKLPDYQIWNHYQHEMALPDFTFQSLSLDWDLCLGQLMARELPQGHPAPSTVESLHQCVERALHWHSNYSPPSSLRQDLLSKFWLICTAGGPGTDCERIQNLEIWLVLERVDWSANCQPWLNNRITDRAVCSRKQRLDAQLHLPSPLFWEE